MYVRCMVVGTLLIGSLALPAAGLPCDRDEQLELLIQTGLNSNHGLRGMTHRVLAAQAAYGQARSAWYPRLNTSVSYTVTDNPPQAFMMMLNQRSLNMSDPSLNMNEPDATENTRFGVDAQLRLYDGVRSSRIAGAEVASQLASEQMLALCNALVHEITRGYYQVLQAQDIKAAHEAALASLSESLRVAGERFSAGSAVKTDVLNLEVQVAQAHENLIRSGNAVRLAVAALNTSMGRDVVVDTGLTAPVKPAMLPAIDVGFEQRPEFRMSALQVRAATLGLAMARGERRPVLNAFGRVDWDSPDLQGPEQSYTAGVAVELPLFAGFEKSEKIEEAVQMLSAAEAEQARMLSFLGLELKQARLSVEEAEARLQVTSRAVLSAGEALRITREQYKEGAVEISVLLMAESGLTEMRMRDTMAIYEHQIARSNLARATGALGLQYDLPEVGE
ncbi:MAG TPA: hypothetical protein DCS43_17430 [Verrucomicrobia bacterium]|nr:hypothetical protein [Verrucomicrobiota bacterium]